MKQSLAARFLFRAVVLAFLVYAMLLTWWTPFTGDSLMHSVFGADHRLAFLPVRAYVMFLFGPYECVRL